MRCQAVNNSRPVILPPSLNSKTNQSKEIKQLEPAVLVYTQGRDLVSFKRFIRPFKPLKKLSAEGLEKLIREDPRITTFDKTIQNAIIFIKKNRFHDQLRYKRAMEELVDNRNNLVSVVAAQNGLKKSLKITPGAENLKKLKLDLDASIYISDSVAEDLGIDFPTASTQVMKEAQKTLNELDKKGAHKYYQEVQNIKNNCIQKAMAVFEKDAVPQVTRSSKSMGL